MRPDLEQLQIEVAPAPNAIGRWNLEHELDAYGAALGGEALERQKRLAKEARECTCGKQEAADKKAEEVGERKRTLQGHQHLPGCNSYRREAPKLIRSISGAEQKARYEEQKRVDDLQQALARMRAEEEV